jgi:hypothetical protein
MHIVDHSSLLCILGYCTYGFRVKQLTLCNPLPQLVTPSPTKPTQKLLTLKAPLLRYSMGPLIALLNGPPYCVTQWASFSSYLMVLKGLSLVDSLRITQDPSANSHPGTTFVSKLRAPT